MPNNRNRDSEFRDRDERARNRDELSRGRDELARDQDDLSQRRTRAARSVQTWATIVVIIMVSGLFYIIAQRNDAIDNLQQAATRIELAATHTEEVLIETVEEGRTPEATAQAQRVREALEEIAEIRQLLCQLPELVDKPACNQ